jgi:hypothetical protein
MQWVEKTHNKNASKKRIKNASKTRQNTACSLHCGLDEQKNSKK